MDLNYELSRRSASSKYLPAGKRDPWIQRKLYIEAGLKFLWPGEKKGRFKGILGKNPMNIAFQGNQPKSEAIKSSVLAFLKAVNTLALPISSVFTGILKELSPGGK